MVAINANMTNEQGWIPLPAADAEALVPGYYTIGSESVTAEGIRRLGRTLVDGRWRPYVTVGVWCHRGVAGTTKATHTTGAALTRYYPDQPSGAGLSFDATAPTTQAFGDVAAAGSAVTPSHRDHRHGMPAEGSSISALPAVTIPADSDEFVVNQGGTSKKLTLAQVSEYNPIAHIDPLGLGADAAAITAKTNAILAAMKAGGIMVQGSRYRDAILAMAPLAYWRLGEPSGAVAVDEMGLKNGAYVNAPTLGVAGALAGDPDTAASFALASAQHVVIDATAALHPGDTFSVVAWVKRVAAGVDAPIYANVAGDDIQVWIWGGDNKLYLSKYAGAHAYTSTDAITDTNWHMVAISKAGATLAGYIDGVASANLAGGATIVADTGQPTRIAGGATNLNGSMDEVAFWNRGISAAEVAALWAAAI